MADPNFSDVRLLLHCNGTDGSQTFTDSSTDARTIVARGQAQIDTAVVKYGSGAALFDGSGDCLTVSSVTGLAMAGDFTIEFWARFNSTAGSRCLIALDDDVENYFYLEELFVGGTESLPLSPPSTGAWHHYAWVRSGSTHTVYINGTAAGTLTHSGTITPTKFNVAGYYDAGFGDVYDSVDGYIDDVRVTIGLARYTATFTPPAAEFEEGATSPEARILDTPGPLAAPRALAQAVPVWGYAADPGPLSAPAVTGFSDISALVVPSPVLYLMDLITPDGPVRVPISSWQATLQTDATSYVQCVVPAAQNYTAAIEAATDFAIYQRLTLVSGEFVEYLMAEAPLQVLTIDQGPGNFTATISGYGPAFEADPDPSTVTDRELVGVRSVSTYSSGIRVRCSPDFSIRPGQRAYLGATPILVAYINFYAPGGDQYMDLGDRN